MFSNLWVPHVCSATAIYTFGYCCPPPPHISLNNFLRRGLYSALRFRPVKNMSSPHKIFPKVKYFYGKPSISSFLSRNTLEPTLLFFFLPLLPPPLSEFFMPSLCFRSFLLPPPFFPHVHGGGEYISAQTLFIFCSPMLPRPPRGPYLVSLSHSSTYFLPQTLRKQRNIYVQFRLPHKKAFSGCQVG